MTTNTQAYLQGMRAQNDFMAMLQSALQNEMPGVILSRTGCMWWRGFRIASYKELARGQYYSHIYTTSPHLVDFLESYDDPSRRKLLGKENYYVRGSYFYPFTVKLDLKDCNFFSYTLDEQEKIIRNFIRYGVQQALIWQNSEGRTEITAPDRLKGEGSPKPKKTVELRYARINHHYLTAFESQNKLFEKLLPQIKRHAPLILSSTADLKPNKNWHHFDVRGYRMKVNYYDGSTPKGPSHLFWGIYNSRPERLFCQDFQEKTTILEFDIQGNQYFDLSPHEQETMLSEFVSESLSLYQVKSR